MKKLISMVDFVSEQKETSTFDTSQLEWYESEVCILDKIRNYANFIKQPLTLGMFVPCDLDGNVFEETEPIHTYGLDPADYEYNDDEVLEYQQAKERVLFDGFYFDRETKFAYILKQEKCFIFILSKRHKNDIESIINKDLQLTPTAIKQLGL